jgi:hypothetical protein
LTNSARLRSPLQRLIHLLQQQQTKTVVSNLSPSWQDTLSVTSQVAVWLPHSTASSSLSGPSEQRPPPRSDRIQLAHQTVSCPASLPPPSHPTPPPSYSEIASCRIDIPRITPQSPPLDDWFRLQTIDRHRLRSQSDHLFPVASGVKFAAEAVAGLSTSPCLPSLPLPSLHSHRHRAGVALKLDPFLSPSLAKAADQSSEQPLDLMIHVHIDFTHLPPVPP